MRFFDRRPSAEDFQDLLDRERTAILNGRFDILERLAVQKERLAGAVLQSGADAVKLAGLRLAAERNRNLLSAMKNGIRAASERIARLGQAPVSLTTYDAAGERRSIDSPTRILHRRA